MTCIRVLHRKNKFLQVSRATLQDNSISLEALGFLCYCLSQHPDFIFHREVICNERKIGKDKFYSIINELYKNGYAFRYQYKDLNNNRYGKNYYVLIEEKATPEEIEILRDEFKKSLPHPDFPLPAFPLPENPEPYIDNRIDKYKETTTPTPSKGESKVVVSSIKEKEQNDLQKRALLGLGLKEATIDKAFELYNEKEIEMAKAFCQNVEPTTSVDQQFMWACKTKPDIPDKNQEENNRKKNLEWAKTLVNDKEITYDVGINDVTIKVLGLNVYDSKIFLFNLAHEVFKRDVTQFVIKSHHTLDYYKEQDRIAKESRSKK